jgi:hypothetical protein
MQKASLNFGLTGLNFNPTNIVCQEILTEKMPVSQETLIKMFFTSTKEMVYEG